MPKTWYLAPDLTPRPRSGAFILSTIKHPRCMAHDERTPKPTRALVVLYSVLLFIAFLFLIVWIYQYNFNLDFPEGAY